MQLVKKIWWLPFVRINVMSSTLVSTPYPGTVGHIHIDVQVALICPCPLSRPACPFVPRSSVPVETSLPLLNQRPCPIGF